MELKLIYTKGLQTTIAAEVIKANPVKQHTALAVAVDGGCKNEQSLKKERKSCSNLTIFPYHIKTKLETAIGNILFLR